MHNIPLKSIESFTHINDKNTKGQDIKVIGYTFYKRHFIYAVLINNEVVLMMINYYLLFIIYLIRQLPKVLIL
jgi:hypothetical protein